MKRALTILVASLLALPHAGQASWFEFCDLAGDITEVASTAERRQYTLDVDVASATRSKQGGLSSYTDCTEHIGQSMQIVLTLPRRAGQPSTGDRIEFSRSAVDVFDSGGYAGTSVQVRFRALRKVGR